MILVTVLSLCHCCILEVSYVALQGMDDLLDGACMIILTGWCQFQSCISPKPLFNDLVMVLFKCKLGQVLADPVNVQYIMSNLY